MSENLFDDYNENTEMSLEDQIAFHRDNIDRLKKDLQENGHKYLSGEYEMTENYIDAIQTVVKELQEELKEEMTEKMNNGLKLEGDLESLLKNPYREENFKIEQTASGSYAVRSDSKKFGEQAIVYENMDRHECVNYIEERQPAKEPEYYVIENLHDFVEGKNANITYGTLQDCLQKYSQYMKNDMQNSTLNQEEYNNYITCTLGVTTGKNDMDLVRCINGTSYAATGIITNQEHNTNKYVLDDVKVIMDVLDIQKAMKVEGNSNKIDYIPLEQLKGKEVFAGYSDNNLARKESLVSNMSIRFSNGQIEKALFNGVELPRTGYKGAPEVTQERFNAMLQNGSKNMNLKGCYISEVTIQGKFENASFENCYFSDCRFENAEFINSDFRNASIHDSDAVHVKFSGVSLEFAGIYNAKWEDTHFKNVDFINCTWKNISTPKPDTVSFENCDFLLADMNAVYMKGIQVVGEMKHLESVSVTLGGATAEEVEKHRENVIETFHSGEKKIGELKAENRKLEDRGKKQQIEKPHPADKKDKVSDRKLSDSKKKPAKKAKSR